MKVKDLIKALQKLDEDSNVLLSQDEEWNVLYNEFDIEASEVHKGHIMYGLTGSEIDEDDII